MHAFTRLRPLQRRASAFFRGWRYLRDTPRALAALVLCLASGVVLLSGVRGSAAAAAGVSPFGGPQAAAVPTPARSRISRSEGNQVSPPVASQAPDAVCARCHQAIYASYEQTTMAKGSGPVLASSSEADSHLVPGAFLHTPSGIRYRVFERDGRAWMSFDREQTSSSPSLQMFDLQSSGGAASRQAQMPGKLPDPHPLHGERQLDYFVGSGQHGRTYLYQVAGTWFELPINYYTRRQAWGMAPAFDQSTTMPADLPTDPNCLHCHATGVSAPLPGSRSHYPGAPFAQGGVGCSACHGDPSAHLAGNGHGPIVNPGHLDVARRDSACLSCHLEGDALVYRPGKSLAQFKAGDDLSETAVYFVRASREGGGGRAASQYEALLRSACKRAAGDRLTCTTCHDPHASPAPSERVAYYRAKCLTCHTGAAIATTHHPEQQDCAQCHMPSRATSDISHEQTVDHDIERVAARQPSSSVMSGESTRTGELLLPVGGWKTSDRELGMAYAQMAAHGDRQAGERALSLLTRAEAAGASDAAMHAQIGFLRQMSGDPEQARAEYLLALKQNPDEPSPLANLAVLEASTGHGAAAVALLDRLVAADPSQTAAGLNLAFIECRLGQTEKSRTTLTLLARYNPDDPSLRTFAETGSYGAGRCNLQAGAQEHARN